MTGRAHPSIPRTHHTAWRQALGAELASWRRLAPTAIYCARTLTAMALALYVAFALQLQAPSSSAITVLIVANPNNGALVSKSLWRLFGTLLGATAAVLLMAAFAQTPLLFFIALSLLIGAACIVSTLLRYFRAYGAVLAGYTIIIVCAPAFADPDNVFISALSRVSAVSIGILSAALVFLLTSLRSSQRLAGAKLDLVHDAAALLAGQVLSADPPGWRDAQDPSAEAFYDARAALLRQAGALAETIEYAAADNYAIARQADSLHGGVAGLMGTLSSLHPLYPALQPDHALADAVDRALRKLQHIPADVPQDALQGLQRLDDQFAAAMQSPGAAGDLVQLGALERARDLLHRLHQATACLLAPTPNRRRGRAARNRLRVFLDWPTALRNGARGAIVTMLAALFWYVTQWPSGPSLLSYLVPAACLLATNPSASRASIDFSIGTLLAIPASYLCETFMLPQINGFPLLFAALAICLLPGIWLQFSPRHGLRAFGYVVFFNAMIGIRNPVAFDDIGLLNGWLSFMVGTASLVVVFRALLPANAARDSDRLAHGLARAAARLARQRRLPGRAQWDYLRMQQALRLIQRAQPLDAAIRQHVSDCALIAVELGRDVLRLRGLLSKTLLEPPERTATDAALRTIGGMRQDPLAAALGARKAAELLAFRPSAPPELARIAALLHEVAVLTEASAGFLRRDFTVSDAR